MPIEHDIAQWQQMLSQQRGATTLMHMLRRLAMQNALQSFEQIQQTSMAFP